jgi:5-methylcytosine-specific restriction endonuclease McrBC regulatory subunit McrC
VANYLRRRLPGVRSQVGDTVKAAGGSPARPLTFRPDVTIGDPPLLVLDTKYARPEIRNAFGGWSFDNSHAYQAAFYARALDCPGVLVYPRVDRDVATDFVIRGTAISLLTVDLSTPGLAGLDALANTLQHRLAASPGLP